ACTWRASRNVWRRPGREGEFIVIGMAVAAYAIALPHIEDYSYTLLLLPAFVLLKRYPREAFIPLCAGLLIFSSAGTMLPVLGPLLRLCGRYSPLVLCYLVWWGYLRAAAARGESLDDGVTAA
ncbi:MAG: hypothetical protein NT045_04855, partial [Candidatus Aureabacteria bacterium]|nr:hypothetical protein [Candidatus Auribacterota bacterium]